MSTLQMDTEQVIATARQIILLMDEMRQQIEIAGATMHNMDWISTGRDGLVDDFVQISNAMQQKIAEGEGLAQRVTHEIAQWEECAAQIGAPGGKAGQVLNPDLLRAGPLGFVGGAIGWVSGSVNRIGKWWEENRPATPVDKNKPMSEQDDYLLQQFSKNLLRSPRGKEFLEELKRENLGFRLPDGTILGYPDGKIIPIQISETDTLVGGLDIEGASLNDTNRDGIANDPSIVISEEWLRQKNAINHQEASATLAHEMQHQLDDHMGRTVYCDSSRMESMGEKELETYISQSTQTRYESEIRAWKLSHEINSWESGDVPEETYANVYESQISEYPGVLGKYHVKVELGENNTTHVNLIPLERINGQPAYIG